MIGGRDDMLSYAFGNESAGARAARFLACHGRELVNGLGQTPSKDTQRYRALHSAAQAVANARVHGTPAQVARARVNFARTVAQQDVVIRGPATNRDTAAARDLHAAALAVAGASSAVDRARAARALADASAARSAEVERLRETESRPGILDSLNATIRQVGVYVLIGGLLYLAVPALLKGRGTR